MTVENEGIRESGDVFCGTRGLSLPILGLCVRLLGAAAETYDLLYSASFLDGTSIELLPAEDVCAASSGAPLEAIQIVLRARGNRDRQHEDIRDRFHDALG